jgi:diguanylate cyclase (GGDEF)-like protein/putative nucleotidyltransferase with HDIG domain
MSGEYSKIVFIHRDAGLLRRVEHAFARQSIRCQGIDRWNEQSAALIERDADAVVLDAPTGHLGDERNVLTDLRARFPDKPLIVITPGGDDALVKASLRAGAWDCLEASDDEERLAADLLESLARARRRREAVVAREDLRYPLPASEHRVFLEALANLRAMCRRMGEPLTIMMLDLDRFRECNERHSAAFGDYVLAWFASTLKTVCRASDLVVRYEGDRFVVALPFSRAAHADQLARRCRRTLRARPVTWNDAAHELGITIGIVESSPGFMETEHQLIQRARITVDHAKQDGPNSTAIWAQVSAIQAKCAKCSVAKVGGVNHWAKRVREQIRQAYLDATQALVAAAEAKEPFARRHSLIVSGYAEAIAKRMGLRPALMNTIRTAAILHDVGKIGVPDAILTKPGPLTPAEYELVKKHSETGTEILAHVGSLSDELPLILHHHERHDGKGYPKGLKGSEIPLGAGIIAVADAIDVMLSNRSYKNPFDREHVRHELIACSGKQFNPPVVEAAIDWLEQQPTEGPW